MKPLPHHYVVRATGSGAGAIALGSAGLPALQSAAPAEFGGPGDAWSPETLLVAAIADCFILTFRAVARAARFEWQGLECETEGTLERVEGVTAFTRYVTRATLTVAPGADAAKARELLERSEKACLIANSLRGERSLTISIVESAAA
ncbi:MAG: OsmC family protein [Gammaproteobacteria bacterium]|nr:OsmC family protein [Gammaproteobacteria bacterium]